MVGEETLLLLDSTHMSCFIPSKALIYNLLPAGQVRHTLPWRRGWQNRKYRVRMQGHLANEEKEENVCKVAKVYEQVGI